MERFGDLVFYDGNGFKCFMCRDRYNQNMLLFGNNEYGTFKVANYKNIEDIARIELEAYVNGEAKKQ